MANETTAIGPPTEPIPVLLERPRWRDTFDALRVYNFRLYMVAQFIAYTSTWMQRIAIDWLVFELTKSVALVGVTVFLQFSPVLLFGVWGGLIADRFDKRKLLIATQTAAFVLCGGLAAVTLAGVVHVWEVYLVAFLLGLNAVVDSPTRSAFVNEMVGHGRIRNAISLNASLFQVGGLIGPAISGVLVAVVGSGWSIGVNSAAAVVVVATLACMRKAELLPAPRVEPSKGQIREGLHYALGKPTIFWPIVMLVFVSTFGMTLPVLLVSFADTVYRTGATGYGLYSSVAAVGALIGALLSIRRQTVRLRSIVLGAALVGLALIVGGVVPVAAVFLIAIAGVGLTRLLFSTAAESMVQLSTNRAIRGRVMAIYVMVMLGGQSLGGPLIGWVAQTAGVRAAMTLAGVVPVVAAIVVAVVLARSGRLSLKFQRRQRFVTIARRGRAASARG